MNITDFYPHKLWAIANACERSAPKLNIKKIRRVIGFLCTSGFWEREIRCSSRSNHDFEITPFIYDLERAVGQYIIYRNYLQRTHPDHQLYLAITNQVYETYFDETIQIVVDDNQLKLIVVDLEKERITKWVK